ncbi:DNA repair protein RecN [Metallibacterium scheffleri]|uniref:DNA repair protein RecN n=1 Tax=Metallibacterium scheffleri TaxID=993689 RepID=A0A4S3KQU5_9GAMM|nr:DNA repair protein RecN [Metallibacterium scheffleri]THD10504.1 DNA repair protein RecN [Metallibacterium scheffleri]
MLTTLYVRDLAVVAEAEITLGAGLTVVTGETGAGKSLLVDALLLLGGARADATLVRSGAERAEVSAEFDLAASPAARAWLHTQALDDDGHCSLRRVLAAAGGSRAWINGRPVALAQLGELAAHLLEIHGQHEHQALLQREQQLALLDAYGAHSVTLLQVRELAQRLRALAHEAATLGDGSERDARLQLLAHQCTELERWALPAERLAALEAEQRRLGHAERLLAGSAALVDQLEGDDGLRNQLARAAAELARLAEIDADLGASRELLDAVLIQLGEAGSALAHYAEARDLDPDRLAEVDAHLQHLHDLARKHRCAPDALPDVLTRLRDEHAHLHDAGARLDALARERDALTRDYDTAAAALGAARQQAAQRLGAEVSALMGTLGMPGGHLQVALEATAPGAADAQGRERCEFLISTNPGQALRPLRRVASGGELARISLALEVSMLGLDDIGCMVFDEVDSGIGGAVAEIVGHKLRALGRVRQVLCVTHLAQVAAQGHAHLRVSKHSDGAATRTQIETLDVEGRRDELARMLGGVSITPETRAHARAMLEQAQAR